MLRNKEGWTALNGTVGNLRVRMGMGMHLQMGVPTQFISSAREGKSCFRGVNSQVLVRHGDPVPGSPWPVGTSISDPSD